MSRLPSSVRPPSQRGFTLIELLTSMSVLALMLVTVVQMINSTSAVTAGSSRHLDADAQARLVFDRMAVDFAQIVKRNDVDYYFQKNGSGSPGGAADDQMAFYSETTGYYPNGVTGTVPKSNTSLVGYRIHNRQLERLDKALVWNGVTSTTTGASGLSTVPRGMTLLPQTLTATWPGIAGDGSDPDYHVLGEQILRLELSFLVCNATTPARLSDTPFLPATTTGSPYNGMRDVAAIIVTIAVLDNTSRLIIGNTDLDAAAARLDDSTAARFASAPTTTPAQAWRAHVNNGDLVRTGSSGGLPKPAAAQVRVYERYFYLGNTQ